jgi:hypothetical protein
MLQMHMLVGQSATHPRPRYRLARRLEDLVATHLEALKRWLGKERLPVLDLLIFLRLRRFRPILQFLACRFFPYLPGSSLWPAKPHTLP